MPDRAYYVERKVRSTTIFLVRAASAREALKKAKLGEGNPISNESTGGIWGQVRVAHGEDVEDAG
jgi:hypothetical protein